MMDQDEANPDFTSLGDIALTLVCVLLLFISTHAAVRMSAAQSEAGQVEEEHIVARLALDADGAVVWDGSPVGLAEFERRAAALPSGAVVTVSGTLSLAGATAPLARLQAGGVRLILTNGG